MTLHEIATPYNEETAYSINKFLKDQGMQHYANRFFSFNNQCLFFDSNGAVIGPDYEARGRTIVTLDSFIKTYYHHIKQEKTTYKLINYHPLDMINDLKESNNNRIITRLKKKSKLNITKYRRS